MAPKKRPAAASEDKDAEIARLRRLTAELRKENAKLRGESPSKKPPVSDDPDYVYVTGLLAGTEYPVSYDTQGFEENSASELATCLSESIRDGRDFEMTLKGGKKVDLSKTFGQNGIEPNSFVYLRYTGPPPPWWE